MLRIIVITLTLQSFEHPLVLVRGPNQAVIENWVKGGAGIASYSDIRQVGFPNRYDVTLNDLRIAKNDFVFEPYVEIMRPATYRQDHFVLAFSNDIKIVGQNITTSQNRASIGKQENDIQRVVWEANDIALDNGATIKHGQLAIIVPPKDREITLYLQLSEIAQNVWSCMKTPNYKSVICSRHPIRPPWQNSHRCKRVSSARRLQILMMQTDKTTY